MNNNYELVKQQAPALIALSKKVEAKLVAKRYEGIYDELFEIMDKSFELLVNFIDTLAAYVVASNAMASAVRSASLFANAIDNYYQLPFYFASNLFGTTEEFLCKNRKDINAANLLASNAIMTLTAAIEYQDTLYKDAFSLFENKSDKGFLSPMKSGTMDNYITQMACFTYASLCNLKEINPSSVLIPQISDFLEKLKESGCSFYLTDIDDSRQFDVFDSMANDICGV